MLFFQIMVIFLSYISNACHCFSGVAVRLQHTWLHTDGVVVTASCSGLHKMMAALLKQSQVPSLVRLKVQHSKTGLHLAGGTLLQIPC